jgi:hypothetical protein
LGVSAIAEEKMWLSVVLIRLSRRGACPLWGWVAPAALAKEQLRHVVVVGPIHALDSDLIILSADKELSPPDRCRRSGGSGLRYRPDEPRREERTPDR